MLRLLRTYTEGELTVTEYTYDGSTVATTVKEVPYVHPQEHTEQQTTLEDVAEETLLETKYQTLLLEMML